MESPIKKRRLAPKGGFDDVMTPPELAFSIMSHFRPSGAMLEPCRGDDAFYRMMPAADWCEIKKGRDFLSPEWPTGKRYDWIITNPPYSMFRDFLIKSMELSNNIVFLAPFNHFMTRARLAAIRGYGFGIIEMLEYPLPAKPWPSSGFALGAVHLKRGWTGSTQIHAVQGI